MLEFLEERFTHKLLVESEPVQVAAGSAGMELYLPLEEIEGLGYKLDPSKVPCRVCDATTIILLLMCPLFKHVHWHSLYHFYVPVLQISKEAVDDPLVHHNHPSFEPSVYQSCVSIYPPRIFIDISHLKQQYPEDCLDKHLEVVGTAKQCSVHLRVTPKQLHSGPTDIPHVDGPTSKLYAIDGICMLLL